MITPTLFIIASFIHNCYGYYNKPTWTKHDFKVLVEPSSEECYYQKVTNGSVFHVSFQLIQGDDINFYIQDPMGYEIFRLNYDKKGSHQISQVPNEGDYKVCVDNRYSGIYHKQVFLYMLMFHATDIKERFQAEKDFNSTTEVIGKSTALIFTRMIDVLTQQALFRFRQARDDYLVDTNNEIVLYWSLVQTCIIIISGIFQVYFIKRLFTTSNTKSSLR